jgi:hypothetical protein
MSMNILIFGEREIFIPSIDKKDTQRIRFDAYQTPTRVTYDIVNAGNPAEEYMNYIMGSSYEIELPVYAEDDPFEEGDPVSYETYNPALEHIDCFKEWLEKCEKDGYTVYYEVI